ncbi:hypothetical protein DN069_12975 [Streptacidiphilus pinicola]|uniref:Uncharacterized protein n=1 Tax=Streptacidiphilus pinicola TaxID=2219663 RepID=A0A2X0K7G0_9ACTN|nr:hypothetical protein [Streptacidiphilus pinicola]RAG85205.1 hypothetical protein DN069_12975 [Streptacidiphilus pinicola]
MNLTRRSATLAALIAAALMTAAQPALANQWISLDAASGDSSVTGHAELSVTRDHGGYRITGAVEAFRGCVELKAVNMHLGDYWGGDTITKTCKPNTRVPVDSWTHHGDVVLTALVDGGPDWDSRIVALHG